MLFLFFFSSRRRHTRWPRDWSSDVCSSDLAALVNKDQVAVTVEAVQAGLHDRQKLARRLARAAGQKNDRVGDRKSTRLNSSHVAISYAVFCLKKKNNTMQNEERLNEEL